MGADGGCANSKEAAEEHPRPPRAAAPRVHAGPTACTARDACGPSRTQAEVAHEGVAERRYLLLFCFVLFPSSAATKSKSWKKKKKKKTHVFLFFIGFFQEQQRQQCTNSVEQTAFYSRCRCLIAVDEYTVFSIWCAAVFILPPHTSFPFFFSLFTLCNAFLHFH